MKAAYAAGETEIFLMVKRQPLTHKRRIAIALSHNALVGEDDKDVLKKLYEMIDDVELKLYSGINDKMLDILPTVSTLPLSESNLEFTSISFVFLPDEIEKLESAFKKADSLIKSDKKYLAKWKDYDDFMTALSTAGTSANVKNAATALSVILSIFKKNIRGLQEYFLSNDEPIKNKERIPINTILGDDIITAETGAMLKKAIQRMMDSGEGKNIDEIIVKLSKEYLYASR